MKPIVIKFTKEAKSFLVEKTKKYHFDGVSNYIKYLLFNSEPPKTLMPKSKELLEHMQKRPMEKIAVYLTEEEHEWIIKRSDECGFSKVPLFVRFFSLEYEPSGIRLRSDV